MTTKSFAGMAAAIAVLCLPVACLADNANAVSQAGGSPNSPTIIINNNNSGNGGSSAAAAASSSPGGYAPTPTPAPQPVYNHYDENAFSIHSGWVLKIGAAAPTDSDLKNEFSNWYSFGVEYDFSSDASPMVTPFIYVDTVGTGVNTSDTTNYRYDAGIGIGTRVYFQKPSPDPFLPFVSGGVGYYTVGSNQYIPAAPPYYHSVSSTNLGYKLGLGVLVGDRFTLEAIYTDPGTVQVTPTSEKSLRNTMFEAGIRF